ncbi:response regulator [Sorangium sp. So ce367]|uniref:response regulator n=1 Tax=Sorangium sp. So ce367 TaxID=3133305 RepID=UPI003F5D61D4
MAAKALNIILVEDDDVDVMGVQRALRDVTAAFSLWIAHDGVEALAVLRSNQVPAERRLVLLDLSLPRMNGFELLRSMRADPALKSTVVVVLTSSTNESDKAAAYRLNIAGYLLKPMGSARFAEVMDTLTLYWNSTQML